MTSVIEEMHNTNQFMLVSINRCMDYAKVADGVKLVPKLETCHIVQSMKVVINCLSPSSSASTSMNGLDDTNPMSPHNNKTKIDVKAFDSTMICSHIITDKHWFQENLLCLLSNARKFTPYGKIEVRLSLQQQSNESFDKKKPQPMLLVEVEDSGIGIPEHLRNSLFEPFKQAQQRAGGTGLGLYSLSRRIQALGGTYGVSERLDRQQGSRFWFTFPYRPDAVTAEMTELISNGPGGTGNTPVTKPVSPTGHSRGGNIVAGSGSSVSGKRDDSSSSHMMGSTLSTLTMSLPPLGLLSSSLSPIPPSLHSSPQTQGKGRRGGRRPSSDSSSIGTSMSVSRILTSRDDEGGSSDIDITHVNTFNQPQLHKRRRSHSAAAGNSSVSSALTSPTQQAIHGTTTATVVGGIGTRLALSIPPQYQILLVDDSSSMLKISSMILTRAGHTVTKAENGLEALMILDDAETQRIAGFDVMIIDLHMPVMDGLEAIRRLRAKEEDHAKMSFLTRKAYDGLSEADNAVMDVIAGGSVGGGSSRSSVGVGMSTRVNVPDSTRSSVKEDGVLPGNANRLIVIACSANDDEETIQETKQAGADAFLTKPYTAVQFMDLMTGLVASNTV